MYVLACGSQHLSVLPRLPGSCQWTGQKLWDPVGLHLPSLGVIHEHAYAFKTVVSGNQIQVFMTVQQAIYQLGHLLNPWAIPVLGAKGACYYP